MSLNVETVLAVSVMLSVFAAVAAVGTSLILGVGFERLRAGFEAISKQTGFFSDLLNKLEKKVEATDAQTAQAAKTVHTLEMKVDGMAEQANVFAGSIQELTQKVEVMEETQPAAVQSVPEPANPHAVIQRYFESGARNALVAASKERERKEKNVIKEKMYAIANEIDRPSPVQQPVKDLQQWADVEEPARIHYN